MPKSPSLFDDAANRVRAWMRYFRTEVPFVPTGTLDSAAQEDAKLIQAYRQRLFKLFLLKCTIHASEVEPHSCLQ
jgi:hypothetical protein